MYLVSLHLLVLPTLNGDIDVDGHTELDDLKVSGVSTFIGKVGIGTTAFDVDPDAKLQVNGAIFMAGDVTSQGGDGSTGIEIGAGAPGIGTEHHRIRSAGGSGQNLMFESQTADVFAPGGDIIFKTGGTANRIRILKDGNVGINTASPIATLDVNGTLNVSGVSTFAGAADFNGDLDVDGHTELDDLNVSGVSTFTGAIDANGDLDVDGTH